jgi:hypothetical protein
MMRLTRSRGALSAARTVLCAQARSFSKYESGSSPTLYLSAPQGHSVHISESEWVSLLHDVFGVPLTNYYKSRYPTVSIQDVENIRQELRNSFHFSGDWKKKYESLKMPEEMFKIRARLEAELDPTNAAKLQAALEGADATTNDGFGAFRLRQLQDAQKAEKSLADVNSGSGPLSAPAVDFDYEYSKGGFSAATHEKRLRYERLKASSMQWDQTLPGKWLAAYRQCADERQKDVDIDYLRYLEGHIRDQFRAEKWYQRLSEDGEETLTYEEVEAWMPEYTDTLYVDYDGWWELVSRNTEASQWDKYFTTADQYYAGVKQAADSSKSIADDPEKVKKHFQTKSPFDTFRDIPVYNYDFLAAQTSDQKVKALCQDIASATKSIACAEAGGQDASSLYAQANSSAEELASVLANHGGSTQQKKLAAQQ